MSDMLAVLFVFCILLATGLSVPTKIMQAHHNDRAGSTVAETNPSTVNVLEVNDSNDKNENQHETNAKTVKNPELSGDRQSKVKDRSLVKIINKSKTLRYKLRDPLMNDLFTSLTHGANNNTIELQKMYSSGQAGPNENYVSTNPKLQLPKNITILNAPIPNNKDEIVYTYLPIASLANSSEVEIIKNTILRSDSIPKNKNNGRVAAKRNKKHNVRKFFGLHSSVARELEENTFEEKQALKGSSDPIQWTPVSCIGHAKGRSFVEAGPPSDVLQSQSQPPRTQSIVLRWNLILI